MYNASRDFAKLSHFFIVGQLAQQLRGDESVIAIPYDWITHGCSE
jgi:hypothetical protein